MAPAGNPTAVHILAHIRWAQFCVTCAPGYAPVICASSFCLIKFLNYNMISEMIDLAPFTLPSPPLSLPFLGPQDVPV